MRHYRPMSQAARDARADPEVRERVRSICQSLPARSLSGVRLDIDAVEALIRRAKEPSP